MENLYEGFELTITYETPGSDLEVGVYVSEDGEQNGIAIVYKGNDSKKPFFGYAPKSSKERSVEEAEKLLPDALESLLQEELNIINERLKDKNLTKEEKKNLKKAKREIKKELRKIKRAKGVMLGPDGEGDLKIPKLPGDVTFGRGFEDHKYWY